MKEASPEKPQNKTTFFPEKWRKEEFSHKIQNIQRIHMQTRFTMALRNSASVASPVKTWTLCSKAQGIDFLPHHVVKLDEREPEGT